MINKKELEEVIFDYLDNGGTLDGVKKLFVIVFGHINKISEKPNESRSKV